MNRRERKKDPFSFFLVPFIFLATLNSAGYRYGASDQAFYAPAVLENANPALYPRDSELIHAQAKLTMADDIVGPLVRVTGLSLATMFAALQVIALTCLAFAAVSIGGPLYRTSWAAAALMAALTLRHAIIKSGTNTLEGYFHPRQLAFALGALAIAAFLRGRYSWTLILVTFAGGMHPTTGSWFAIWLSVALFVAEPRLRVRIAIAATVAAIIGAWALTAGPLAGRLAPMDPEWLNTLADRDYLFPLDWPATAWLANLGYIPLIVWIHFRRRAANCAVAREGPLVAGCLSLVLVFAGMLVLHSLRVALAIQLQPARIFWMLDLLAVAYAVWALAEGTGPSEARARWAAACIAALSLARGIYIMRVEFPTRPVVQIDVTDDDWGRAMAWARRSDPGSGWLAHPAHAVRYGTSVRVAGQRDVCVEAIKDAALGMYERSIAMRTRERVEAIGDFAALTPAKAAALSARYDLDYLVTEQELALPLAFSSGAVRIYRLR
jgi:hypothetical protein